MARFQYRESDPNTVERRAQGQGDYDRPINPNFKLYKAAEGKNRIRIMPRTWDDNDGPRHWAFPLYMHYDVGADNGRYPCPQRMNWGDCPICEERAKLDASGDREAAAELRASPVMLCWIIDRNDEKSGPQIFMMPSKKVERPICELSRDEDTGELLKIDHPEKGRDIFFTREGAGKKTDYSAVKVAAKASFLSESEAQEEKWLTFIEENSLPKVLNKYDYDYLSKIFHGASKRTEQESDDEPTPTRTERAPSRSVEPERAPSRVIDEDDSEPPPRSSRRAPVEEEAPEQPAARTRSRVSIDSIDEPEEVPSPRRRSREEDDGEVPARSPERESDGSRGDDALPPRRRRME